jgi:hypothetical protein
MASGYACFAAIQLRRHDDRMARHNHEIRDIQPEAMSVPAGAPPWVTADLIARTVRVWQPFYESPLTIEDALAMIMNVAVLFETFARERHHETIRRPGSGQQP